MSAGFIFRVSKHGMLVKTPFHISWKHVITGSTLYRPASTYTTSKTIISWHLTTDIAYTHLPCASCVWPCRIHLKNGFPKKTIGPARGAIFREGETAAGWRALRVENVLYRIRSGVSNWIFLIILFWSPMYQVRVSYILLWTVFFCVKIMRSL